MSSENSTDLFEHYDFKASSGQAPLRVDKFLMNFIENASRNKIQKAAENGNILVKEKIELLKQLTKHWTLLF